LRKTIKAVVDLTGDLLVLAIRLVRELIETFLKSLETPIDIPVLTTLVRLWSGDADRRLTYFDILTLPGAFLGTAIWKIVSGGRILVSKEQARIFIEWVDKPNGPIDLWAVLERFQPAASGALSDQAPVGAAKGDFPKDPGIVILVLKSLRMAGSFTTLVVLGPLSMANKTMQIWQVDGLFGKVLGALVFVASAVVLVIGVGGMLVQWILEMAAQKHFPSGKAMPKGSPAFNGRGVAIQVVAVVAVLLLMALLMADVLMASEQ
jgi:hypothetical protein